MMTPAEQETVYHTLMAIRSGTKDVLLNHAEVSDYGLEIIAEALKNADLVNRLDLSHITNSIGRIYILNKIIEVQGIKSISEMLKLNLYLQTLNLSSTGLTDENLKLLIEGISINRSLLNLILSRNQITCEGALALAELLSKEQKSHKIKEVQLDNNLIGDAGAKSMAKMLTVNN